jgi:hypothetical protein
MIFNLKCEIDFTDIFMINVRIQKTKDSVYIIGVLVVKIIFALRVSTCMCSIGRSYKMYVYRKKLNIEMKTNTHLTPSPTPLTPSPTPLTPSPTPLREGALPALLTQPSC